MPLGSSEIYMVLRARDEASRAIMGVAGALGGLDAAGMKLVKGQAAMGAGLVAAGAGITAIGIGTAKALLGMADDAREYQRQVALTMTQTDGLKTSLQELGDIGIRIGSKIGVPFDQLQTSLYDIFSSMDVTVPQAEKLLTNFSKTAVAGQVDLQAASRATIAILNAFKIPVEQVGRVQDVMFQLVRKGVGTYQEFATTIGRAIPSSVRAGQSIETLAGMMAFLTRNGLSAAMASASAGRALDAISNPKVTERLQEIGVAAKDAQGNFRPLGDVVSDLGAKFAKLTGPERAARMQDLFKGAGGTIQARRFFDVAILQAGEFNKRVDEMKNSTGELNKAYSTMSNTPATQMQLLQNNLKILRVEIGEALLPILNRLVKGITDVLSWFNNLSPGTKQAIAIFLAVSSVVMIVVGVITMLAGVFLILGAAATALGVSMTVLIGVPLLIIAAIVALIAAGVWLYKNWDMVKEKLGQAWNWIKDHAISVFTSVKNFFIGVWNSIKNYTVSTWNGIINWLEGIWNKIKGGAIAGWNAIRDAVVKAVSVTWQAIVRTVTSVGSTLWNAFTAPFRLIWGWIQTVWGSRLAQLFRDIFFILLHSVRIGVEYIYLAARRGFQNMVDTIMKIVNPVVDFLQNTWNTITGAASSAWDWLAGKASTVWNWISGVTAAAWDGIRNYVINPVENFVSYVARRIADLGNWIGGKWNDIRNWTSGTWNSISFAVGNAIGQAWNYVTSNVANIYNAIVGRLGDAWNWVSRTFSNITDAIIGPIRSAANTVSGWLDSITGRIGGFVGKIEDMASKVRSALSAFNPAQHFSPSIVERTQWGMRDLETATVIPLQRIADQVQAHGRRARALMAATTVPTLTPVGSVAPMSSVDNRKSTQVKIDVHTQEINPTQQAQALGWEIARRVS